MSEWKVKKLGDIADIVDSLHKTPQNYQNTGFPMVRVTDIKQGTLNLSSALKVDEETFKEFSKKHTPKKGDIIFTRVGSYGNSCIVSNETNFCLGQNTVYIIPKIDSYFLYYFLNSSDGKYEIESSVGGSTQPTISLKSIKAYDIPIPPLKEQKAIAQVLSSLDDKIDLLHRQNKTLENLAQTLFRQWFIEEAKDEWEITTLDSFGKAVTGKTPSTKNPDYWGKEISFITPTDFKYYGKYCTYSDRSLSIAGMEKVKNSVLPKDSILVTCIGSDMGKVAIAQNQCVTNQQINSLIINDPFSIEYVYQYLKYSYSLLRAIAMGGTTMPIINKTDFENIEIPLPTNDLIKRFHNITSSFNEKIIQNTFQIKTLENMRDTLLPKFMSGEVRVEIKNLEQTVNV